jgi:DNA-binding MarR family transcriptional regulator
MTDGDRTSTDRTVGRDPAPAAAGHTQDVTDELARLLPELAVALYESTPHAKHGGRAASSVQLTGRQLEAVVFLSHHRCVTMREFADGLEISPAAATELAARLTEKGVVRREADPDDRRIVLLRLAGDAEQYAERMHDEWQRHVEVVFARHPGIDPDALIACLVDLIDHLKGRTTA